MPRRRSHKIIQTLTPQKENVVHLREKKEMLPTPTTSSSSSSSSAPGIGINPPRSVPKSSVRLTLNTAPASVPSTTLDVTEWPLGAYVKSSNQSNDEAVTSQKSYAAVTSPVAVPAQPQELKEKEKEKEEQAKPQPLSLADNVNVDPTRNVQNYLQRDKTKLEPFATMCVLAIRCVVPNSKLVIVPPLLSLDRNPSIIRAVSSYLFSGLTKDDMYLLLKPLQRAIELYLRADTLHIFQLAEAGLKSLQEIYRHSNAEQALQQMIVCLQKAYAPGKALPSSVSASDEPFANLWHSSEISAISAMFSAVNAVGLVNKDNASIWTAAIENTLQLKLAAYL